MVDRAYVPAILTALDVDGRADLTRTLARVVARDRVDSELRPRSGALQASPSRATAGPKLA